MGGRGSYSGKSQGLKENTNKQSEHLGILFGKDQVERYTNLGISNPRDATAALFDYTDNDYEAIREGKYPDKVKLIDEVIAKQPKWDGEIYRGMRVDDDFIENIKSSVGDSIDFGSKGPISFSSDFKIAEKFATPQHMYDRSIVFKMQNKRGSSITHNSMHPSEQEVLHRSGEKYKIKSFTFDSSSKSYVVELEDNE
jgi:hypothetical protein